MTTRPLIYCALFLACTAMSQPIARFLWTPVVRPFDWRPAYGTNAYNPKKDGSRDSTGLQANNLKNNQIVKWNSLTSLIEFNATETLVVGSQSNERKTRWNSNSTINSRNPNLRLVTPTTDPNRFGPKIQIYSAPQRRMIDDRNSSESYLIYSANPLVSPTVRDGYKGYSITGVALVGHRNEQVHVQSGRWTRRDYWYEFTMTSDGRVGLEGEKTFTVAGLPTTNFVAEARLLGNTTIDEPPLYTDFGGPGGSPYNNLAELCVDPDDIIVGEMFRFTRTVGGTAPNWTVNPLVPAGVRTAIDGDTTSSLPRYNRENMYSTTRFFGNFFISPSVIAQNQSTGNNSGSFGTNDPTRTLSSTRSINAVMQLGDLRRKLRILSRLPHLGPDYLFSNVVNPTIGTPPVPNITQ